MTVHRGTDPAHAPVRVASVPADHAYVRNLAVPGVHVLPDPPVRGAPPGRWWPPQVLTAGWIRDEARHADLVHLHFGTESIGLGELRAWTRDLRRSGTPLVFTVHDLDHPHLEDQAPYRDQLDVLVPAADALITLTEGAAAEIDRRWHASATVLPHPQLATDAWIARADEVRVAHAAGAPRIGIHLGSGRANARTEPWLRALLQAVERLPGARIEAFLVDGPGRSPASALPRHPQLRVRHRPRPDDDALAAELATLDVLVLPYAHGTHSGWIELCWDLGTRVVAPDVGHLADQHRDGSVVTATSTDPRMLGEALLRAAAHRPLPGPERLAMRRDLRRRVGSAHAAIYAEILARDALPPARPVRGQRRPDRPGATGAALMDPEARHLASQATSSLGGGLHARPEPRTDPRP